MCLRLRLRRNVSHVDALVEIKLINGCIIVDFADLAVIDLSKFSTPEGRAELATTVRDAMRTNGFFYVINHGMSPEQVCQLHGHVLQHLTSTSYD